MISTNEEKYVINRIKAQEKKSRITQSYYDDACDNIRKYNDWTIITRNNYPEMCDKDFQHLRYRLQAHENIISKYVGSWNGVKFPYRSRPMVFKWINKNDKVSMKFDACNTIIIPDEYKNIVEDKLLPGKNAIDVLNIISGLIERNADKEWIRLDILDLTVKLMQPFEIAKQILEEMEHAGMLVTVNYDVKGGNGNRIVTYTDVKLTITKNQYEAAIGEKQRNSQNKEQGSNIVHMRLSKERIEKRLKDIECDILNDVNKETNESYNDFKNFAIKKARLMLLKSSCALNDILKKSTLNEDIVAEITKKILVDPIEEYILEIEKHA